MIMWMINLPYDIVGMSLHASQRCIQKDTNMLLTLNRLNCHAPGQDTVAQGIIKLKIDLDIMGMSLYASQRY